jgi:ABC-type antimicrobial peptide transport system permease subunit
MRQGMTHAAIGMVIGAACALGLAQLIASQLYGVRPSDPATVSAVLALMAVVALAAVYLPARRAARVDPITALRGD